MAASNYMAIARKWRPQTFDEVVGQEHITRTLTNAIASGRIHHAFLFIGSRGIGKTTTARILAKALNCTSFDGPTVTPCGTCDNCVSITAGNNIDVIEIDGASNNTVDDVREIRENVRMVPTSGRRKVYIIDEVHQLSTSAFNALLKTLEEPPSHAVFVLATTEAHKIPATIVSRCQRYDFRRVAVRDLVSLLRRIIEQEAIEATDEALHAIARVAEGGVRDAESVLDELITYCGKKIAFQDVFDVLGLVNWQAFHDMCDAMCAGDVARQLEIIEEVVAAGKDLSLFVEDILRYYRNLLVCRTAGPSALAMHLPEKELEEMHHRSQRFNVTKTIRLVEQFAELVNAFDSQLAQRTALETLLIRLSRVDVEVSLDTVMEKLILLGQGGVAPRGEIASAPESPPQNPKSAGTVTLAPSIPAEKRRITLGHASIDEQWRMLLSRSNRLGAQYTLSLGRAHPHVSEDGAILILEFEPGADSAVLFFESPEHFDALHSFLREETENIRRIEIRQQLPVHQEKKDLDDLPDELEMDVEDYGDWEGDYAPEERQVSPKSTTGDGTDTPMARRDFDAIAEDNTIAVVLNEFKGRIVDVRRTVTASDAVGN